MRREAFESLIATALESVAKDVVAVGKSKKRQSRLRGFAVVRYEASDKLLGDAVGKLVSRTGRRPVAITDPALVPMCF